MVSRSESSGSGTMEGDYAKTGTHYLSQVNKSITLIDEMFDVSKKRATDLSSHSITVAFL